MLNSIATLLPPSLQIELRRYKFRLLEPEKFQHYKSLRQAKSDTGYSLRSFDKYKCIYVHIPKCAGISISNSLFKSKAGGHLTATDYQLIFSRQEFNTYFKFAFVRNPWDRLYSAYTFMKKGGRHPGDKRWADKHLSSFNDFESFVRNWVTVENIHKSTHFKSQYEYLFSPSGEKLVDFIGYYENLQSDFEKVRQKLNIEADLLSLNKTGATTAQFKNHYTSEIKQIVSDVYQDDIKHLNYDFEGSYFPGHD